MLRRVLLVLGALMFAVGLVLVMRHVPAPGWQLLGGGGALLLALVFERWRYRSAAGAGGSSWQRTGERFEDPETGEVMEVLFDPSSGRRRYVKAMGPWTDRPTESKGTS